MATQDQGKDVKGRSYEQITKDGTSSAGTMGTGGTGDVGRMSGERAADSAQADVRTDDLTAPDADREQRQGYRPGEPGQLETGMEGIGNKVGGNAGNRQSGESGKKP